jgi:hypothetical protein
MNAQSIPPKTPEQIRAERIAAIDDPKLRQQLEEMAKARDAKLAEVNDQQNKIFDERVQRLRTQMTNSANGPQFMPLGEQSRYRGKEGYERADADARLQIQTHHRDYLIAVAKQHNDQIDKHLDNTSREATRPAALQRSAPTNATNLPPARSNPKVPNRYAQVIDSQRYAARATEEAEANRAREREQQRQRGPQR